MTDKFKLTQAADDAQLTLAQKRAVLKNWLRTIEAEPAASSPGIAEEPTVALGAVYRLNAVDTSRES